MKQFQFLLVMAVAMILTTGTGCKSRPLAEGGVYAEMPNGEVLFNADRTIVESFDVLDKFVTWERDNRAALTQYPQITQAADRIRDNARDWVKTATALREAYAKQPTGENKNKLLDAINVLKTALAEATRYMATPPKQ